MEQIEAIADKLQIENSKRMASDPLIKSIITIVGEFIETHPVLLYGGMAINNLLPKKARFYDSETTIPDYDVFSKTPQEHAMTLANKLYANGIKNVEVKPGIHLGTFKVYANFESVADITELDAPIFKKLWDADIVINNIHYVTPNFLRMSMYLELSRPRGDVSRWKKVYQRLMLLNRYYPITCDKEYEPIELTAEEEAIIRNILTEFPVVLLGANAAEIHMRHRRKMTSPIILLADKEVIEKITKDLKNKKTNIPTEILPPITDIFNKDNKRIVRFYETTACHSFHVANGIRVASIPTIMQFFFAYIYSVNSKDESSEILCVAQSLVEIANKKRSRRFAILTPMNCLGEQSTLVDLRREKSELYDKLSRNKSSVDFLRYFFTYDPSDSATRRNKKRDLLKKTQRQRLKLTSPVI